MTREEHEIALGDLRRFLERDSGNDCCSCHINPPCHYCEEMPEELYDVDPSSRVSRAAELIEEHEAAIDEDTNPATPEPAMPDPTTNTTLLPVRLEWRADPGGALVYRLAVGVAGLTPRTIIAEIAINGERASATCDWGAYSARLDPAPVGQTIDLLAYALHLQGITMPRPPIATP